MSLKTAHHSDLTLVIDQGTHASRIALFTETGEQIYLASQTVTSSSFSTHFNESKHINYEQNADEILQSIHKLFSALPHHLQHNIRQCGLCTQRSSIVAWHKTTGKALSPIISWRDTRAQTLIDTLQAHENSIRDISGLPLSAHYSASKMHWLLHNNTAVQQAAKDKLLNIAPLASYLLFHLLTEKPYLIDHSNAQRSQLFDIHQLNWSDTLLQLFQINPQFLPACTPVIHHYGHLSFNNIPVTAVVGDQNAALHAFPELHRNHALVNIGTGAFMLAPASNHEFLPTLLKTLSSSCENSCHFVHEGTVNGAGAAISWQQQNDARNNLNSDIFSQLPSWLKQVKQPPIFINTIAGLGSPWWCSDAGDAKFLPQTQIDQAHCYSAIIESIVFLIVKNIEQLNTPPENIFISGGLSQLDDLCQKLADLSHIKITRFNATESSARGCAWLANQLLKNNHLNWKPLGVSKIFLPSNTHQQGLKIQQRYQQFVGELNKRCLSD